MKLISYSIFTISVLLFSGFARATVMMPFVTPASYQTPVHVEQVSFQPDNKQLLLAGSLPNPCMSLPAAVLTQDQKDHSILTLRLTSPMVIDICIEKLQPYATTLDLPTLVMASQIEIDPKATYLLKTDGYDFQVQILGSDLMR